MSQRFRHGTAVLLATALLTSACDRLTWSGSREAASASQARVTSQALDSQPTGTVVGQRVQQLQAELARLQSQVEATTSEFRGLRTDTAEATTRYQATTAAMTARLQVGTTPGNPELQAQWSQAQALLSQVETNVGRLSALSQRVASNASLAGFILDSTRSAFSLSGGIDQDHADLAKIEDEVGRVRVTIDRNLNEITDDVTRQAGTVAGERRNLAQLALAINSGRMAGPSLSTIAAPVAGRPVASGPTQADAPGLRSSRRPLVVIRFDRPNVTYRQPLYDAVSATLDRSPGATFDLVAVSPGGSEPAIAAREANEARRNAEGVLRSLVEMGLPSDRVALRSVANAASPTGEVHLYLR